jgi:chorismate lyase/3-hydroxybenzoate synthase
LTLGVHCVPLSPSQRFPEDFLGTLGVIGFSVPPRLAPLRESLFANADMPVLGQCPFYEVWTSDLPVTRMTQNGIASARDGEALFAIMQLEESSSASLDSLTYDAYLKLFDHAERAGYPHLLRIYHYLPRITEIDGGLERYRRFSRGRHEAFAAKGHSPNGSPAASALGTQGDRVLIYFLAAKRAGRPLENPRQVSAFRYPPQHGPRSPIFSRAMIGDHGGEKLLFLSGTASIVGHESTHEGDVVTQTREAVTNIRTLLAECSARGAIPVSDALLLKVYLRHAADRTAIGEVIRSSLDGAKAVFLRADICRPELLVEMDGVCPVRTKNL